MDDDFFYYSTWGCGFNLDEDENIIIGDHNLDQILRFNRSTDELVVIAGNGIRGFSGDGGPATGASMAAPSGIAFGPEGHLYFADQLNHRIRRIDMETGIIDTIAGVGPTNTLAGGFSGDGGPAIEAELSRPNGGNVRSQW